jgi:hypothetical protein
MLTKDPRTPHRTRLPALMISSLSARCLSSGSQEGPKPKAGSRGSRELPARSTQAVGDRARGGSGSAKHLSSLSETFPWTQVGNWLERKRGREIRHLSHEKKEPASLKKKKSEHVEWKRNRAGQGAYVIRAVQVVRHSTPSTSQLGRHFHSLQGPSVRLIYINKHCHWRFAWAYGVVISSVSRVHAHFMTERTTPRVSRQICSAGSASHHHDNQQRSLVRLPPTNLYET